MVQAILEGRKTMTRRIMKTQPEYNGNKHWILRSPKTTLFSPVPPNKITFDEYINGTLCPYGMIGDVLWVRETWKPELVNALTCIPATYYFLADNPESKRTGNKFKPSIHMPKAAARIWLEITDVKVERLQDISEEDAIAEGIKSVYRILFQDHTYQDYLTDCPDSYRDPRSSFETLWLKINGMESWDANPWVWVISFKVISTSGKPNNDNPTTTTTTTTF